MEMIDTTVEINGFLWKNPITTASGTFSPEYSLDLYDYSKLGAVTTKGVSVNPWIGNETPRIAESSSGMLNSIGLENPGTKAFIEKDIPSLSSTLYGKNCHIIVNVAGHTEDEYINAVSELDAVKAIDMFEINISCPNLSKGGMSFGTDAKIVYNLTKTLKSVTNKPIILKLTPNVTDICEIAKSAEEAGANAISMINTLSAMSIDVYTGKPALANIRGGLSGPAIKPIALRMVYDTAQTVNIPIIGMGGIYTGIDVVEFLMAGASAIAVGTAALVDPTAPLRILDELKAFMYEQNYKNINELKRGFKNDQ